jgi:hypothetical protein
VTAPPAAKVRDIQITSAVKSEIAADGSGEDARAF